MPEYHSLCRCWVTTQRKLLKNLAALWLKTHAPLFDLEFRPFHLVVRSVSRKMFPQFTFFESWFFVNFRVYLHLLNAFEIVCTALKSTRFWNRILIKLSSNFRKTTYFRWFKNIEMHRKIFLPSNVKGVSLHNLTLDRHNGQKKSLKNELSGRTVSVWTVFVVAQRRLFTLWEGKIFNCHNKKRMKEVVEMSANTILLGIVKPYNRDFTARLHILAHKHILHNFTYYCTYL
jgi:hypothetical protein